MTDPSLPPSRFGAGFTTGSVPSSGHPVGRSPLGAVRSNKLAAGSFAAALVLGIAVAPVTLVLGLVARHQIRRSGQPGAAVATAAVAVSAAYLLVGLVVLGLYGYLSFLPDGP